MCTNPSPFSKRAFELLCLAGEQEQHMRTDGWLKVLQEVRRQASRVAAAAHVQLPDVDGVWFDVQGAEPAVATASVQQAEAWHQQQWLVAFEVLVRFTSPAELAA